MVTSGYVVICSGMAHPSFLVTSCTLPRPRQSLLVSAWVFGFTSGLAKLLKAAVAEGLEAMVAKARALRGPLAAFRDLVLADATGMRLKDLLAGDRQCVQRRLACGKIQTARHADEGERPPR